MKDLTAETRIAAAEAVVREQRSTGGLGTEAVVRDGGLPESIDVVDADDYRDLRFELERLQRTVMGETEP